MIRTIVTKARAMMIELRLDDEFWAEAVNTATYIQARCPSRPLGGKSPYQILFNVKPELHHLRCFGCAAYKLIPTEQRTSKFSPRSRECIMIGYVYDTAKIWRLWDPVGKRIIQASDVTFDESRIVSQRDINTPDTEVLKSCIPDNMPLEEDDDDEEMIDMKARGQAPLLGEISAPVDRINRVNEQAPPESVSELTHAGRASPADSVGCVDRADEEAPAQGSEIRPSESTQKPTLRRSARNQGRLAVANQVLAVEEGSDPTSYREALTHSKSKQWKEAMKAELKSLELNGTWSYADRVATSGKKAISCKWVYKTKLNLDGSTRYKARLVIRGFEQVEGIDFGETFAPVAKLVSLCMLLAAGTQRSWHIKQMNVVTAFLNPPIDEKVYMELPEGFDWLKPELKVDVVCKLKKALYGLKQAPRLWYKHIDSFLRLIGFKQSTSEPNLYIGNSNSTKPSYFLQVLLLLFVDDLLLSSKCMDQINRVKRRLQEQYRMTDLGSAAQFLGLGITQLNGTIYLDQRRFIDTVLRRFGMQDCNEVSTPLEHGTRLRSASDSDSDSDQA